MSTNHNIYQYIYITKHCVLPFVFILECPFVSIRSRNHAMQVEREFRLQVPPRVYNFKDGYRQRCAEMCQSLDWVIA